MAYMMLGHGAEHLSAPRDKVPDGSMVVVAEECGMTGTLPPHVLEAIQDPTVAALFADPVRYRRAIETLLRRPIKIYTAGATIPHMTFALINYEQPGPQDDPDEVNVGPSGIWPIPSPAGSLHLNPAGASFDRYTLPAERAGETFVRSVFPFDAAERGTLAGLPLSALRHRPSLRTSMDAILAARPGIYYHFLCRDLAGPNDNLKEIMRHTFHAEAKKLFDKGDAAVAYNVPAVVQNWLDERPPLVPTAKQAAALNRMQNIVNRVMTRRRASRSSSGTRRASRIAPWALLHQRITHSIGSEENRVRAALELPADLLNRQDPHDGGTLVSTAAARGDVRVLDALLGRGASPALKDWEGMSPLHWGVQVKGAVAADVVRTLLAAEADIAAHDDNGNTVLHGATAAAIPLLVAAGVPHSEPNAYGSTPLHIAAADPDADAVDALLALEGIQVDPRDRDGETPLMLAVQENGRVARRVVRALLAKGADVSVTSHEGKTAVDLAIEAEVEETLLILLAAMPATTPVEWWKRVRAAAATAELDDVVVKLDRKLAGRAPHWLSSSTPSES